MLARTSEPDESSMPKTNRVCKWQNRLCSRRSPLRPQGEYGKIVRMKTVLVFSTSTGNANTEMMDGVRKFAQGTDWNIQSVKFDGSPFPIRELLKFWSPIGCIVEASGNGLKKDSIPYHAFGKTPVVYIGGDSLVVPPNATCVVHDANATGEAAARELLAMNLAHFAFLGMKGHNWSLRRKEAFASAMRLNGRSFDAFDLSPGGTDNNAVKRWLANLPKPCGIFAASDAVAETVLAVCRLADISVPEDIAVIGVDDNEEICENTLPTLTSIHPDFRQGGRFAARLLARKLLGHSQTLPKTEFAVSGITRRGSTRRFKRKDSCVADALERIWKPGGERLSAKDIVAGFPCSRRNAEIRFRLATGHSVLEELTKARIRIARQLLADTQLPVSAVAERCGYASIAHFRDTFRKATGHNPLEWRRLSR